MNKVPDIVHAALGVVRVDFKSPDACVLGLATSIDTLLLVHGHHLMADELKGVVVSSTFTTINGQDGGRAISLNLGRVPLTIIHVDGAEPNLSFLGPERVQVVPEAQFAVLNLQDAVLSVVLIRDAEQFAMLLSSPETKLDLGGKPVRLKAQGILDVALRVEGGWHCFVRAVLERHCKS